MVKKFNVKETARTNISLLYKRNKLLLLFARY